MRIGASALVLLICLFFSFTAKSGGILGSSVLISRDGYLITAEHVIAGCASLNAVNIGPVIAVGHDKANDLALLKLNASITAQPLPLSMAAVRLGEEVIAVGYPLEGILGGLNVTNGIVSGVGNTSPQLQFTAPVQSGNSGGALLHRSGALAGILTLSFRARFGFVRGGFAVGREVIQTFLSTQSVRPVLADNKPERSRGEIVELARKSVFAIECLD
jgi:S1-C subfamily serine protease